MRVGVSSADYSAPQPWIAFFDEVLRRVRTLPGVQAAGIIDSLPMQGGSNQPVAIEGHPSVDMAHQPEVSVRMLTPGYVEALHIPLLRGRLFSDSDTATSNPVVVVSESMARRFWPNEDPIGKRLALTFVSDTMREVVGVIGDVKDNGLASQDPVATLYWPISQFYFAPKWGKYRSFPMQMAVRTSTSPADATAAIRHAIHEISPSTPVLDVKTMEDLVAESISPQRFNMFLLAAFAGLALLLAAVGIYSVLAYAVRRRVREIGVRMALGAQIGDVLRMIVFDGMKPTLVGVAIGLAASLALSRVLSSLVFGVKATDIPTFLSVSALLVGVGFFASVMPAYRATRVDPLKTLRDE
jgi:predicted permease